MQAVHYVNGQPAPLFFTVSCLCYILLRCGGYQCKKYCDSLPSIDLVEIKFNYGPTGSSVAALSIRRQGVSFESSGGRVRVPEWIKGDTNAADSPAAYAISKVSGKKITIQAKFIITRMPAQLLTSR